jgi:hypothetical protein
MRYLITAIAVFQTTGVYRRSLTDIVSGFFVDISVIVASVGRPNILPYLPIFQDVPY